ncbi:hypothetical protein GS502_11605 [Rhodococcus hoagii]|nr:hypothetical protein [Prescottella equi]
MPIRIIDAPMTDMPVRRVDVPSVPVWARRPADRTGVRDRPASQLR